jgi:hypothetical protein
MRRRWWQRFEFGQIVRQPTVPARFGIKFGQINAKIHNQRWADGGKAVAQRSERRVAGNVDTFVSLGVDLQRHAEHIVGSDRRETALGQPARERVNDEARGVKLPHDATEERSLRVGLGGEDAYFDQHCAARVRVRTGTGSGRRGGRCRHGWRARAYAKQRNARERVLSEMELWLCENMVEGKRQTRREQLTKCEHRENC